MNICRRLSWTSNFSWSLSSIRFSTSSSRCTLALVSSMSLLMFSAHSVLWKASTEAFTSEVGFPAPSLLLSPPSLLLPFPFPSPSPLLWPLISFPPRGGGKWNYIHPCNVEKYWFRKNILFSPENIDDSTCILAWESSFS